ncbi:MAG TPA: hypothetical protein VFZ56_02410 [Gemmatimonadaceae bacterium]
MTDHSVDEAKVKELLELTQALPRESEPPESAWAEIRAQLTERPAYQPQRVATWQRPAFLAAAALLLVAASAAVTSAVLTRDRVTSASVATAAARPANGEGAAVLAALTLRENEYLQTVNGLNELIEADDSGLAPETIRTIRASLLVIDAAILEVRQALAADPANAQLLEILEANYEKKVDLLRRTTEMARSG